MSYGDDRMSQFKWSKYNYYIIENDMIIVFNFYSMQLLHTNDKSTLFYYLQNFINKTPVKPPEDFIEKQFVVCANLDEDSQLEKMYTTHMASTAMQLTIFANEMCNFKCIYCYEDNTGSEMSHDLIPGILNFIKDKVAENKYETLNIEWFGGEPLLSHNLIFKFSTLLSQLIPNLHTTHSMSTNGYRLDPPMFERMLNVGVNMFQISLDGNKSSHDQYRMTKNGKGTFDTIWSNIEAIHQNDSNFNILIRANFNEQNYMDVFHLIDLIKTLDDKRFSMHFHPIVDMGGTNNEGLTYCCDNIFGDVAVTEYFRVCIQEKVKCDAWSLNALPLGGNCYASNPNFFAIDVNGIIRRCTVAIKSDFNEIGRILNDHKYYLDVEQNEKWLYNYCANDPQCDNCEMKPHCYGPGCPEPLLRNGERPCRKNTYFFDEILKEIVTLTTP